MAHHLRRGGASPASEPGAMQEFEWPVEVVRIVYVDFYRCTLHFAQTQSILIISAPIKGPLSWSQELRWHSGIILKCGGLQVLRELS